MKKWMALIVGVASGPLFAGEISLMWVPQLRMEYEGTGYREVPSGWELKVKPWTPAGGLRWRAQPWEKWGMQTQFWANRPTYAGEFGNSAGGDNNQSGQAEMALKTLWWDVRTPMAFSRWEMVAGMNGLHHTFRQKDVVFHGVSEPTGSKETQRAVGVHLGVHGGAEKPIGNESALFWDGELLLGHYLWTDNRLKTAGGSIRRGGYNYLFRAEGGWAWRHWRMSLGYTRHLYEILVPGGRRITEGADSSGAAGLPINKIDLFGFFLGLTRRYG